MSREVKMDEALTDEDRAYLRQRGAYGVALEERIDANYPPDSEALAAFEKEERRLAAAMNGAGLTAGDQTSLLAENDRLRAELAALRRGSEPPTSAPVNYAGMRKPELEAEIDRVNAEDPDANLVKGTVAEMAAALAEYFAE